MKMASNTSSQPFPFLGTQMSPELFDVKNLATWRNLMPAIAALTVITTTLVLAGWIFHLVEPALRVSFLPTYAPYSWVKGKRGFGQFFRVAYDCVFASQALFKLSYEKVSITHSSSCEDVPRLIRASSSARPPTMYSSFPSRTCNRAFYSLYPFSSWTSMSSSLKGSSRSRHTWRERCTQNMCASTKTS